MVVDIRTDPAKRIAGTMTTIEETDPFDCPGCHSGDFAGFDHFCDALGVKDSELPQAFAAYLSHETGWDGPYEEVTNGESGFDSPTPHEQG